MKKNIFLLSFAIALVGTVACNRKHNCQCIQNSQIGGESYSNIISETELSGMKTEDAAEECDKGDVDTKNNWNGTEWWNIKCELN